MRVVLAALVFLLASCTTTQHVCEQYIGQEKGYCYARTELNAVIAGTNQSFREGGITAEQHAKVIKRAADVDRILDSVNIALGAGMDVSQNLIVAKKILLELSK